MSDIFEKLFSPFILPAALVGLSSNIITEYFPGASKYIGWGSLLILLISSILYFVYRINQIIVPQRLANLIFLLDGQGRLATITHPHHKRVQPPGTRLKYHEGPHEAIARVIKNELGIEPNQVEVISRSKPVKIGETDIVASPFQVQIEHNKQRLGVKAHYDFLYVCRLKNDSVKLHSELNPEWRTLKKLKEIRDTDISRAPFANIISTFEYLEHELKNGQWFVSELS